MWGENNVHCLGFVISHTHHQTLRPNYFHTILFLLHNCNKVLTLDDKRQVAVILKSPMTVLYMTEMSFMSLQIYNNLLENF